MIEILFLLLSIQGILCAPGFPSPGGFYVDIENDAEIIDAAEPLPGTNNLHEKTIPLIRLQIPSGYLTGVKNLGEKSQLPTRPLPGVKNLMEKAMPLEALQKSYERDQQELF